MLRVQHTCYLITGESAILQKARLLRVFSEIIRSAAKLLVPGSFYALAPIDIQLLEQRRGEGIVDPALV